MWTTWGFLADLARTTQRREEREKNKTHRFSCAKCLQGDAISQLFFFVSCRQITDVLLLLSILILGILEVSGLGVMDDGGHTVDSMGMLAGVVVFIHFLGSLILIRGTFPQVDRDERRNILLIRANDCTQAENFRRFLTAACLANVFCFLYILFVFLDLLLGALIVSGGYVMSIFAACIFALDYDARFYQGKMDCRWCAFMSVLCILMLNSALMGLVLTNIYS